MVLNLLNNIWLVFLDTAFWLLVGLLAAGFIKTFISEDTMQRWVGGNGIGSILRAALFGAPLPLCSCGVLPAAIGLRRAGASKEATVSFLISTPETSVDSVAVTYALMGPVMAVFRPVAALFNAVGTGLLTTLVADKAEPVQLVSDNQGGDDSSLATGSCCPSKSVTVEPVVSSCCAAKPEVAEPSCSSAEAEVTKAPNKFMLALSYAGAELLDDISKWCLRYRTGRYHADLYTA